jgi:hypothetical protein
MYTAEDRPYCLNNAQEVGAEKVSDPNVKDAPENGIFYSSPHFPPPRVYSLSNLTNYQTSHLAPSLSRIPRLLRLITLPRQVRLIFPALLLYRWEPILTLPPSLGTICIAPTSPKKPLPDFMTMKEAERSLGLKKIFASAAFIEGKFSIDGKFCVTKPGRCNKCTVSRVPCIQPVEGRIRCSLCVRQGQSCYTSGRKRLRGDK